MQKSRLLPIFLIVFVDLLGFSLILPLLPFYAEAYGATPLVVGLLTASYAAAQLIGAPILGRLSDRFGRRPVLLASIAGTFVGFLLLGFAEPIGKSIAGPAASHEVQNILILVILFLSRIIDGLTGGNITVAQAYITDVTGEKDRARGLGLIGAAFGLGFILGPAAGGVLSAYGYSFPALAAAGLSAINLLLVVFLLPESLTPEIRARIAGQTRPPLSISALWTALKRPLVGPLLHIRFFYGLAFAIFQTMFPLFAQLHLNLDPRQVGFILAYVGVLAALVQGFGVGMIAKLFSEYRVIFTGSIIMAFSLLAWAFTPNVWLLLVILAPLSLAGGTLNTLLSSVLTKAVTQEEVGGTLGISTSLESLTRVLAPILGGFLFGQIAYWAPGVFATLLMLWVVSFAWLRLISKPDLPQPPVEIPPMALPENLDQ